MKTLKVKIVTPQAVVVSDEYVSITLPSAAGELTVLAGHVPLVSKINYGGIVLKNEKGESTHLFISSGILEVRPGSTVIILADDAQRAESINIREAEIAKQRVEEILKQRKDREEVDYAKLKTVLEKEMARIKVGRKYRNIKRIK